MSRHTAKDRIMLKKFGNQQKEPLKQMHKSTFIQQAPAIVWNPIGPVPPTKNNPNPVVEQVETEIVEEMVNEPQTAGLSAVPMFIWYIAGAGILLYVAKKQKWIK